MDISGDHIFDAPQSLVWDALKDPNVLGSVMPGGKEFTQTGDNEYSGMLEVKVGPVQGAFQGKITLSDIVAPDSYQIVVDGKGAPGFVKATGKMHLEARDNQTFMEYSGQAQVGGRIASVGQRLMESAARSIINQSLEALDTYLKVEASQATLPPISVSNGAAVYETTATATPTAARITATESYRPPSQTTLAINVARDVLNDLVPVKYQPWLLAAIVFVVLLVIWLVTSR